MSLSTVEGGVPLQRLFHDDVQAGDLVGTGSVPQDLFCSELGEVYYK